MGLSSIQNFHDMTNAFASVVHPRLGDATYRIYHKDDAPLSCQRDPHAIFLVQADGLNQWLKNWTGSLPGDVGAATVFRDAFSVPVQSWTLQLS